MTPLGLAWPKNRCRHCLMWNLDLRKLRYFVAVADTLHFGGAAEQPTLARGCVQTPPHCLAFPNGRYAA
jgi:hypothetical protein